MREGASDSSLTTRPGSSGGFAAPTQALQRLFGNGEPRWRRVAAVSVLVTALAFVWSLSFPAVRVGDGMEYYALFYAWKDGLRPWMTPESFQSYQLLFESGHIEGMLPADVLRDSFPALRVGQTADFNHFWLYSLLAAIMSGAAGIFGVDLGPHSSFMLLHAVLLGGTIAVCGAMHGWRGIAVVLIIVLTSPLIWYVNKVHTEFFSFCLTLSSMAFLTRGRFVFAALAMAAAGTQNPGLLLPALVLLSLRVIMERDKTYSFIEVAAVVGTVGLMAVHPFYYLARYDTITTQLLAGGAEPGVALGVFYIWLIDPDLGLFPNWILGFFFLVFGALQWRRRNREISTASLISNNFAVWIGMAVFFLAAIYSHSSTVNLNSGGSPGMSRYALWYIAPLYPLILLSIWGIERSRLAVGGLLAATVCSAVLLTGRSWPSRPENVATPSFASRIVQQFVPFLYTPPPEVFRERFGGIGESAGLGAVVGPDCRKVLIIGSAAPERGEKLFVPGRCSFRAQQILAWTDANRSDVSAYHHLENSDIQAPFTVPLGQDLLYSSDNLDIASTLAEGWSSPEPWGVWSEGSKAIVVLQLADAPPAGLELSILLNGFTPPSSPTREVSVSINGAEPVHLVIDQGEPQRAVRLPIDQSGAAETGMVRVEFLISNPISPSQAGLSADGRNLGIGLVSMRVEPGGRP